MSAGLTYQQKKIRAEDIARVDSERKHLETLLQTRINFFVLFVSAFLIGMGHIEERMPKLIALGTGTVVSLLFTLAALRTWILVQSALNELEVLDDRHPYVRYRKAILFPPNANILLVVIPPILTVLFLILTVSWFFPANHKADVIPPSCAGKNDSKPAMRGHSEGHELDRSRRRGTSSHRDHRG